MKRRVVVCRVKGSWLVRIWSFGVRLKFRSLELGICGFGYRVSNFGFRV
jgi:hypothetical protein